MLDWFDGPVWLPLIYSLVDECSLYRLSCYRFDDLTNKQRQRAFHSLFTTLRLRMYYCSIVLTTRVQLVGQKPWLTAISIDNASDIAGTKWVASAGHTTSCCRPIYIYIFIILLSRFRHVLRQEDQELWRMRSPNPRAISLTRIGSVLAYGLPQVFMLWCTARRSRLLMLLKRRPYSM